jgi:hypothetical protein
MNPATALPALGAISSRAAVEPQPSIAAYSASKAALLSLILSVAKENKDRGITANIILPGTMDTPANRTADPKADFSTWVDPQQVAKGGFDPIEERNREEPRARERTPGAQHSGEDIAGASGSGMRVMRREVRPHGDTFEMSSCTANISAAVCSYAPDQRSPPSAINQSRETPPGYHRADTAFHRASPGVRRCCECRGLALEMKR